MWLLLWPTGYLWVYCLISTNLWVFQYSYWLPAPFHCDWRYFYDFSYLKCTEFFCDLTDGLSFVGFHVHLKNMCILLLLGVLCMSIKSNWLIMLFKSSIPLLICLDIISLIQGETSIAIFEWMIKTINFIVEFSIVLHSSNAGLYSGAQLNYLGSFEAFWGLFPMPHVLQGL